MGKPARTLNDAHVPEIRALYHALGLTQKDIARLYNVDQKTVSIFMNFHDIPTYKGRQMHKFNIKHIEALLRTGHSLSSIAAKYQAPISTMQYFFKINQLSVKKPKKSSFSLASHL